MSAEDNVSYIPPLTGKEGAKAVRRIYAAGGKLVPIGPKLAGKPNADGRSWTAGAAAYKDMKAAVDGWQRKAVSQAAAERYVTRGGIMAIVPWATGLVVVDVDYGDPHRVAHQLESFTGAAPVMITRTGKPGRAHIWCRVAPDVARAVGSRAWPDDGRTFGGASGEFKGATAKPDTGAPTFHGVPAGGYVIAWDLPGIADTLAVKGAECVDLRIITAIPDATSNEDAQARVLSVAAYHYDRTGDVEYLEKARAAINHPDQHVRALFQRTTAIRANTAEDPREMVASIVKEQRSEAAIGATGDAGLGMSAGDKRRAGINFPDGMIKRPGKKGHPLVRGEVLVSSGTEGHSKSSIALGWMLAAATARQLGKPWGFYAGLAVRAAKSYYASWEDTEDIMAYRLQQLAKYAIIHVGDDPESPDEPPSDTPAKLDAIDHIRIAYLSEVGGMWSIPDDVNNKLEHSLPDQTPLYDLIFDTARRAGESLLVFDPAESAFTGNSSHRPGVAAYLARLAADSRKIGASSIVIAHANKAAGTEKGTDADRVSGAGTWTTKPRGVFHILAKKTKGSDDRTMSIQCAKASHGEAWWTIRLKRTEAVGVTAFEEDDAPEAEGADDGPGEAASAKAKRMVKEIGPWLAARAKKGSRVRSEQLRTAFADHCGFKISRDQFMKLMQRHGKSHKRIEDPNKRRPVEYADLTLEPRLGVVDGNG